MLSSLWEDFLKHLEKEDKKEVLVSVLKQVQPTILAEDKITLSCDNVGTKIYLANRSSLIEKKISAFIKKTVAIELIVKEKKVVKETPLFSFKPTLDDVFHKAGLHAKYRFDNFAVSSSNQVAFAAAQAVVKNPGSSYNPLFLYGGVGVGKTHLAQAIARTILEKDPEKKILFSPGDQFINELVEAIREKATGKFRRKHRPLDVLIVDDIQFIAGKVTVQEEFFHTFNAVISSGGQIILTSDRPPVEIKNLEDRLRSRFSGGLTVDVQSPDFELRTAILLIKAKEKGIEIGIDVAKIISERITDSRALEGTLLSIYAKILGKQEGIDIETVEAFFQEKQINKAKKISFHDVIRSVCAYYHVKQSQIKSPTREERIVFPRQIIMFILRKELKMNLEVIANILKRKDHTTVMHGADKISEMIINNPSIKQEIDRIKESLSL